MEAPDSFNVPSPISQTMQHHVPKIIIMTFIAMRTLDLILYLHNDIAFLYIVSEKHFVLLI